MRQKLSCNFKKHRGIALFAALIFIAVFMAMSVGMMTMSSRNTAQAANLQSGNLARSTAESGLEYMRYLMKDITIDNSTLTKDQLYGYTIDKLLPVLADAGIAYEYDDDDGIVYVGPVDLDEAGGRSFEAVLYMGDSQGVNIRVKGTAGGLARTLESGYTFGFYTVEGKYMGFDFGVATKGPLSLKSLEVSAFENTSGVEVQVGADAYIESLTNNTALTLSNAKISGDVKIVNPSGQVSWSGGQSSIGGEGDKNVAIADHVQVGVAPVDFPDPDPGYFNQYVGATTLNTPNATYNNITLENVRIAAGTNPKFTGNTVVKGVLYIEQPNVVDFGGNANITGVIVGNGDVTDNSGTNQVNFTGTVTSNSASKLPNDAKFDGIRNESGTFLMAPGFAVSFGGNFGTLNGCIVANGVKTYGNAGGEIMGSIINYATTPMLLEGKNLRFNRSNKDDVPSGFKKKETVFWTINYAPTIYSEIACGN